MPLQALTAALTQRRFRRQQPMLQPPNRSLSGLTRDKNGVALGNCTVKLYLTWGDQEVATTTSDGGGNYSFAGVTPSSAFYIVAYLPGSPDVTGTTVNTLIGA